MHQKNPLNNTKEQQTHRRNKEYVILYKKTTKTRANISRNRTPQKQPLTNT